MNNRLPIGEAVESDQTVGVNLVGLLWLSVFRVLRAVIVSVGYTLFSLNVLSRGLSFLSIYLIKSLSLSCIMVSSIRYMHS